MIAGANRDPAVFDRPNELDLTRPQGANVTFAPGLHFCIGHFLAKMQLGEFFQALVSRFDAVQLLDEGLHWGTSVGFRGLQKLNVRLIERPH
jgi:cytochrome P450